MTDKDEAPNLRLTEVCWPVFDFAINFVRQAKAGVTPAPDQVRYEALTAVRDAEDLAQRDPLALRAWEDHLKAMMVYFLDYRMLNMEWAGRDYWFDNRFETDPQVLNNVEALGGEKFFQDCDAIQKEYELAERRDRRDKYELAEKLNLYFICLRLGFKGQYHDRPQELADYTRRLWTRLPAYATTRGKEMFPDAYKHNQEFKVDYRLGMSLTVVLVVLAAIVGLSLVTFRVAWSRETGKLTAAAEETRWSSPAPAGAEGGASAAGGKSPGSTTP